MSPGRACRRIVYGDDKEVLHTATLRYRNDAGSVFGEANDKISAASEELGAGGTNMMFVTVFAGILDLATGRARLRKRGHDSPFVMAAGSAPASLPLAGGPPLGTVDDLQVFDRAASACAR